MNISEACLIGIYELPGEIICELEVLGKSFNISLGILNVKMVVPKASVDLLNAIEQKQSIGLNIPSPVCPIENEEWGNKDVNYWGTTLSFPKALTKISKVVLVYELEKGSKTETQEIYNNVNHWFSKFFDIKELLTGVKSYPNKEENSLKFIKEFGFQTKTNLQLYLKHNKKLQPIIDENEQGAKIFVTANNSGLNTQKMEELCTLVNKNKEIKFEHEYYLKSLRAFYKKDYVNAVALSSPALEKIMLCGIEDFCKKKNIYFLNNLLKKYRMLGGLFLLAKDLNMTLPTSDYKSKLLNLRNNVIHKGYYPSSNEVKVYLDNIKIYLEAFSKNII